MRARSLLVVGVCVAGAACATSTTPTSPSAASATLPAPTASAPADQAQLTSLRPTLNVANSPSGTTGTATYEFQVSDKSDFSSTSSPGSFPVLAHQTGVAQGTGGTTSYTPDFHLPPL